MADKRKITENWQGAALPQLPFMVEVEQRIRLTPAGGASRKQPFTREHATCRIYLSTLPRSNPLSVAIARSGAL